MRFEIRRVQNGVVLRVESEGEDSDEEIVYQKRESDEIDGLSSIIDVQHSGPFFVIIVAISIGS